MSKTKKKKQEFDASEWMNEVFDGVDIPDEQREALEQILGDEKVTQRVANGYLRQSDYSRAMDELRDQMQEAKEFIENQKNVDHNNADKYNAVVKENEKLRRALASGDLDLEPDSDNQNGRREGQNGNHPDLDTSRFIDEDKLLEFAQKFSQQKDAESISYMNRVLKLTEKFRDDFGKSLDLDEYTNFAAENSLNLDQAYEPFTRELREEKTQKEREDWERQRTQEIETQIRSRYGIPLNPQPTSVRSIDALKAEESELRDEGSRKSGAAKLLRELAASE